jgi:hypothetical protein
MIEPQHFVYSQHAFFFSSKEDAQSYLDFIANNTKAMVFDDLVKLHPDEMTFSGLCITLNELEQSRFKEKISYLPKNEPMELLNTDEINQIFWNVKVGDKTGWIVIRDWMQVVKVELCE